MILKFIQAETKQPLLIMASAIASVSVATALDTVAATSGSAVCIGTSDGRRFVVFGTLEQIHEALDHGGINTTAIAPIG